MDMVVGEVDTGWLCFICSTYFPLRSQGHDWFAFIAIVSGRAIHGCAVQGRLERSVIRPHRSSVGGDSWGVP